MEIYLLILIAVVIFVAYKLNWLVNDKKYRYHYDLFMRRANKEITEHKKRGGTKESFKLSKGLYLQMYKVLHLDPEIQKLYKKYKENLPEK